MSPSLNCRFNSRSHERFLLALENKPSGTAVLVSFEAALRERGVLVLAAKADEEARLGHGDERCTNVMANFGSVRRPYPRWMLSAHQLVSSADQLTSSTDQLAISKHERYIEGDAGEGIDPRLKAEVGGGEGGKGEGAKTTAPRMMPVIRAAAADVRTAAQRLVYKFAMPYAAILPEQTDQHTRSEDPSGALPEPSSASALSEPASLPRISGSAGQTAGARLAACGDDATEPTRVWIGGVWDGATEAELQHMLATHEVPRAHRIDLASCGGYCHMTFASAELAWRCVCSLDGVQCHGGCLVAILRPQSRLPTLTPTFDRALPLSLTLRLHLHLTVSQVAALWSCSRLRQRRSSPCTIASRRHSSG